MISDGEQKTPASKRAKTDGSIADGEQKMPASKKAKTGDSIADGEQKMPASKKVETGDSISAPSQGDLIDLPALKEKWSTGREERFPTKKIEFPPGEDQPILRGGDFVLNEMGCAASISFCFMYQGERYGLTVGHLANMGESVFCFAETNKQPKPLPKDSDEEPGEIHLMYELGPVVSKSIATDSLVFKITSAFVATAESYTLSLKSGLDRPLNLPDPAQDPPRPLAGDALVGFGAQRRGAHGFVRSPSETTNKLYSKIGNIGFVHSDGDDKTATDPGDCGTIFVGLDTVPFCFHHCADTEPPYISYGFPLAQVMASHTQLGGTSESNQQQEQQLAIGDCDLSGPQQRGLAKFKTEIAKTPTGYGQSNALAPPMNVRVVPAPRRQRTD